VLIVDNNPLGSFSKEKGICEQASSKFCFEISNSNMCSLINLVNSQSLQSGHLW